MEEIEIAGQSAYASQTTVHPLGLLAVVVLGLCVLLLPRRWSVLPLLIMACFVPSAQMIVIAGLHFNFLRLMVLFGVIRLIINREYINFVWKSLDKVIMLWTISSTLIYVIQQGSFSAFVNRLGFAFDVFGMYFLFRCLIRNWEDLSSIIFGTLLISIPIAMFFLLENRTGHNVFSIFGGVPEITIVREGRLRCQGAFPHSILAGCFWASLMPLFAAYWWKSAKDRVWSITGLITASIIVVCCSSSTPIMGVLAAIIGGFLFYFRHQMRLIRWGVLLTLVALHMVMNAPVWHLIARISAVGGSTGYHRFQLINGAINNFGQWWLIGCSGYTVASWGVWAGDVTNQYILEGVRGGFLTMCLFVAVIVIAFREVGRLWRLQVRHPYRLAISWGLGVSLFVHCINFIGVSYFGQIHIIWYLVLAIIGSLSVQTMPVSIPKICTSSAIKTSRRHWNRPSCGVGNNV
jgi:hypothetical protein